MTEGIEITMDGLPQFEAGMVEMAGEVAEVVARRAMRAGGMVVQAAITEAAPVRPELPSGTALPPGALKSDIELHVAREKDGSISAYIEPGKYTLHVARFVEYGHQLIIHGKNRGTVPAHPFIRPAAEACESATISAIEQTAAEELTKEAKRRGFLA